MKKILANWHNSSVALEFILFKSIGAANNGVDDNSIPWKVIFKDTAGNYLLMQRNAPAPPSTVGSAANKALDLRYRSQNFKDIDCLFETNNSVFFLPGKSDSRAVIENIKFATTYINQPVNEPGSGNQATLFDWAKDNFSWEDANISSSANEVKSGKWNGQEAVNGGYPNPFWNMQQTPTKLELWDNRNFGFK